MIVLLLLYMPIDQLKMEGQKLYFFNTILFPFMFGKCFVPHNLFSAYYCRKMEELRVLRRILHISTWLHKSHFYFAAIPAWTVLLFEQVDTWKINECSCHGVKKAIVIVIVIVILQKKSGRLIFIAITNRVLSKCGQHISRRII